MYISTILLVIMTKKKQNRITVPDVDIAPKLWKAMFSVL